MKKGLFLLLLLLVSTAALADSPARIAVGSKNFGESRLLAEMFAQLIEEDTELTVERRLGLAGTTVCFEALKAGAIDLYPEYTGTGFVTLLKKPTLTDPVEVLRIVRREFSERWDLVWLSPLGFQNSYEVAVRAELAKQHALRTISDLVPLAPNLTAGFGYEFTEREDGLQGLTRRYGIHFGQIRNMQQNLKYQAAGSGKVDVLDVYTTDGLILVHDLVVLEDDRKNFPPYQAVPLVRGQTLREHPEMGIALGRLAGVLDEERMRQLNRRIDVEGISPEQVAQEALWDLGLTQASTFRKSQVGIREQPFGPYFWSQRNKLLQLACQHMGLVGISLLMAILFAVPAGVFLERQRQWAERVIRVSGVIQTVPAIALLAFMIPLLGLGARPAIAALFLYSLFPILRNSFTGVREADPRAAEAAFACGMSRMQLLWKVRLPLAAPVIMAGIRTAAVINVGTATLAAFIGAGGLGEPIVAGLQLADSKVILSGALPAAALAVLIDLFLGRVELWIRPKGLESSG